MDWFLLLSPGMDLINRSQLIYRKISIKRVVHAALSKCKCMERLLYAAHMLNASIIFKFKSLQLDVSFNFEYYYSIK